MRDEPQSETSSDSAQPRSFAASGRTTRCARSSVSGRMGPQLSALEGLPYAAGGRVQIAARRPVESEAASQAEAVAGESRDDGQVEMEDLLPGRLPVGQIQVDSLAAHAGPAQRRGQALADSEQAAANGRIHPRQVGG